MRFFNADLKFNLIKSEVVFPNKMYYYNTYRKGVFINYTVAA